MDARPRSADDTRSANAHMAATITQTPAEPYREGTYVLRVAEIRGRRSGRIIPVPIAVVQLGGSRYLVSPTRERLWARNLLAAGECMIVAGGERETYRTTPAPDDEAVPVLRTYVAQLPGWASQQFPFPINADDAQILAAAPQTAVFRLDPPAH